VILDGVVGAGAESLISIPSLNLDVGSGRGSGRLTLLESSSVFGGLFLGFCLPIGRFCTRNVRRDAMKMVSGPRQLVQWIVDY
jgi:hypothetical protein